MKGDILALDLATVSGWAEGPAGGPVRSGSVRFAPAGSTHGEIALGAIRWFSDRLTVSKPSLIVYEAVNVQHMAGKTNLNTIRVLCGLPFLLEGVAQGFGIYDIREAKTADVRKFFIGSNPQRKEAKQATIDRCRMLGHDPVDDNAADAFSLHFYMAGLLNPRLAMVSTPLFGGRP